MASQIPCPPRAQVYTTTTGDGSSSSGPPPTRVLHDQPPTWDGKDPDNQVEPYLKLLAGWLATTRTLPKQRGMIILQFSHGDLKLVVNELDIDKLTHDDSGQLVYDHIKSTFLEYLEKRLPKAMERALFQPDCRRHKHETMLQYVSRKKTLLGELTRSNCRLPENATGYIMLRDAMLSDRAWDMVETWTKGNYDITEVASALRKLERPIPGRGGTHLGGLSGFVEEVGEVSEDFYTGPHSYSSGPAMEEEDAELLP